MSICRAPVSQGPDPGSNPHPAFGSKWAALRPGPTAHAVRHRSGRNPGWSAPGSGTSSSPPGQLALLCLAVLRDMLIPIPAIDSHPHIHTHPTVDSQGRVSSRPARSGSCRSRLRSGTKPIAAAHDEEAGALPRTLRLAPEPAHRPSRADHALSWQSPRCARCLDERPSGDRDCARYRTATVYASVFLFYL